MQVGLRIMSLQVSLRCLLRPSLGAYCQQEQVQCWGHLHVAHCRQVLEQCCWHLDTLLREAQALLGASLGTLLTGTRAIFGASFCGGTLLTGVGGGGRAMLGASLAACI